ncbi:Putative helicase L207/L206 [Galdieria sulphuraria]|nr:Putative helicase L207/L206 [Galdieria sulphuraria]
MSAEAADGASLRELSDSDRTSTNQERQLELSSGGRSGENLSSMDLSGDILLNGSSDERVARGRNHEHLRVNNYFGFCDFQRFLDSAGVPSIDGDSCNYFFYFKDEPTFGIERLFTVREWVMNCKLCHKRLRKCILRSLVRRATDGRFYHLNTDTWDWEPVDSVLRAAEIADCLYCYSKIATLTDSNAVSERSLVEVLNLVRFKNYLKTKDKVFDCDLREVPNIPSNRFTLIGEISLDASEEDIRVVRDFLVEFLPEDWENLLTLIGWSITGRSTTGLQRFVVLIGSGGNGKGLLIQSLANAFPNAVKTLSPAVIDKSSSSSREGPNPTLRVAASHPIVCFEEAPTRIDESLMKLLTGGGTITTRGVFERTYVESDVRSLVFLLTNFVPHLRASDAIQRRMLPLMCRADFTKYSLDHNADIISKRAAWAKLY